MNARNRTCAECGALLAEDAPQGLCPQCLLKAGLQSNTTGTPEQTPTVAAPSPGQSSAGGLDSPTLRVTDSAIDSALRIRPSTLGTVHYFGDYELLEEIARGGMGVVYKARQVSLNRIVALKMILAGQLASEVEVRRFRTEAEAAANLQHPNIVAIHEVGQYEGRHYFSMDYVEGRNLAQAVASGRMPAAQAAQLVKLLAEAIQYAHQRGILHRDLKPQNVLLDERGQPRVTDFGLAKRAAEDRTLTQSGAVLGSPGYMAPEQAAARLDQIGPATDVYGLGAILYHLLTGQPPFCGSTVVETMVKVVEEQPAPLRRRCPGIPTDLETICLKCLEKRPERRYATARALAEDLGRFLVHEPILARPPSRVRKTWVWLQKHPWAIAGASSFLVIGLVVLAYGLWQQERLNAWTANHPGELPWIGCRPLLITLPFLLILFWLASVLASRLFSQHFRRHKLTGAPFNRPVRWLCLGLGATGMLYALLVLFEAVGLKARFSLATSSVGLGAVWPATAVWALLLLWPGSVLVWKALGTYEFSTFDEAVARSVELEEAPEVRRRRFRRLAHPTVQGPVTTGFVVFLGCLLVPAGYWTARAWSQASASYGYARQLMASGRMLARTNYLASPVPDEVNFATTRFLQAIGFKQRLDTNVWAKLLPFERMLGDEGNFSLAALGERIDLNLIAKRFGGKTPQEAEKRAQAAQQVLAGLTSVVASLDELRQASTRPYAQVEMARDAHGVRSPVLLHGAAYRLLGQLMLVSASAELELGRIEEAQRDLGVSQKLADSVSSNYQLANTRLRADLIELWTKGFWEGLGAGRWPDQALLKFETWLASVNLLRDLDYTLRGEEPYWNNRSFEGLCAMAQTMPFFPFDEYYGERLLYNQLLFDFCDSAFNSPQSLVFPARCQQSALANRQRLAKHVTRFPQFHFEHFPNFETTVVHVALAQTRVTQARLAGALTRYRRARGTYPENLDRLAPDYLPRLAHDLISGKPLVYHRTAGDNFVLYSVGWNQSDDGGTPPVSPFDLTHGDWVWPTDFTGAYAK